MSETDYKIRFARKIDLEGIARLKFEGDEFHSQFDLWPPECDMDEARNMISLCLESKSSKIFVAVDEARELIGFVLVSIRKRHTVHSDYRIVGEIGLIFIKPDCRRNGIGTALVKRAVEYLDSKSIQQVTLRVVAPNKKGIKFWESLSFETKVLGKTTTVENVLKRL